LGHKSLVGLNFAHELTKASQTVAKLDSVPINHVSQNKSRCTALAFNRLNKELSSFVKTLVDETVSCTEVFLSVLLWVVVDVNIKILKELLAGRVRFTSHIEHVSNAEINHFPGLEGGLVWSHKDAGVHFNQLNFFNSKLAIDLTCAHGHVGETGTRGLLLFGVIIVTSFREMRPLHVLIDGVSARDILGL
jgi:hypothetical protein